jgi:hypothetical protein
MPCPNVQDISSMMHYADCEDPDCYNGMLQVEPQLVWGYFNNDQLNKLYEVQGEYDENIAVITFSAKTESGEEAEFHQFDRVEMMEYTKRVYEMIETSPTGIDRLKYKAIDGRAFIRTKDRNKKFIYGTDFVIDAGKIRWLTQNRPGYNQSLQRGDVYTIYYYIRPTFFIHHVMKEVRATQVINHETGEKIAVRLPQHVMVLRELMYADETDDKGNKTTRFPRNGFVTPG